MRALFLSFLVVSSASAWVGNEIDFPGDGQGWDLATTNSTKFTGPDNSPEWFRFQWTAAATAADFNFKMVAGNNWVQDYGGNLIFPKNELALLYYQPLGDTPAKLSGGVAAGKRYVFTAKDPGLANTFITVMELSAAPVSITGVTRDTGSGLITISLSGAPSPEEKVYIRYTDSAWTYSQVLAATVVAAPPPSPFQISRTGRTTSGMHSSPLPVLIGSTTASPPMPSPSPISRTAPPTSPSPVFPVSQPSPSTVHPVPTKPPSSSSTRSPVNPSPLSVSTTFNAGTPPSEVELVTNLNRRDRAESDANADGIPDGIPDGILPPPRDLAGQNDSHYYRAYPMAASGSTWSATLPVNRTGAYRATVRYRFSPTGPWFYYGDRDHAIVVSPKKTLEMTLYELNPLTVEATANTQGGRSTFVDLLSAADGDTDGTDPVSLDYFNLIQANCLWFQPIHPTGGLGVENDPSTSAPYVPGSPYATKDFFAVNPYLGTANTEASALAEFQAFVAKADTYAGSVGTINVMLDFVANHSAWDAIYGQGGVALGFTGTATTALPVNWYSRTGDYGQPATYFTSLADKDKAVAPRS